MKKNWYLQPWFYAALLAFTCLLCRLWWGFVVFGAIVAAAFAAIRFFFDKKMEKRYAELCEIEKRRNELEEYLTQTGYYQFEEMKTKIEALEAEHAAQIKAAKTQYEATINEYSARTDKARDDERAMQIRYKETAEAHAKIDASVIRETKKLGKIKDLYKSVKNCLDNWLLFDPRAANCTMPPADFEEVDMLAPTTEAKLHSLDIKDLRRALRENERQMEALFTEYEKRYTTKANAAIFALIVIALRSELQTILLNLRFETTEKANLEVQKALQRALLIAADGNQSILPTLTKFIGQLEHHFYEAVKIEHVWYVRKEQQRQEQIELRARMKEEADARKANEEAQKRVAEEEAKYRNEIERLRETLAEAEPEKQAELSARLQEVQSQMAEVAIKKDEIAALAKGKAGTVYIVSNLGAFGDSVFKVGMTRRFDPQERVDELGSASVPFEFDVHSFIFSEDAVALEGKLHKVLEKRRLNKINPHKEFFNTTVDELEKLVQEIEPTAEFSRTMLAEEFRASQENIELAEIQPDSGDDDDGGEDAA